MHRFSSWLHTSAVTCIIGRPFQRYVGVFSQQQRVCVHWCANACVQTTPAWMNKRCLFVFDSGSSSVVHCVFFVRNFCVLSKGNFWIQLFSPTVILSRGKNVGNRYAVSSVWWKLQVLRLTIFLYYTALTDHISVTSSCKFLTDLVWARSFCLDFWHAHLVFSNSVHLLTPIHLDSFWGNLMCFWTLVCVRKRFLKRLMLFMPQKFAKSWSQKLTS